MTFGDYPLVSPEEARDGHFAAKKLFSTGINPMAERKAPELTPQDGCTFLGGLIEFSLELILRFRTAGIVVALSRMIRIISDDPFK